MNLANIALRNRTTTLFLVYVLLGVGLMSFNSIPHMLARRPPKSPRKSVIRSRLLHSSWVN